MNSLDDVRRYYAEEIRAAANVRSEGFAKVPRERFLGPGPWQIMSPCLEPTAAIYRTIADADPRHLYHNILVAIDSKRQLNNGQPSFLALCLDALELHDGDRVLHVGCGVGYYTAIIAEVVGPSGHVVGIEIDPELASRARNNLAYLNQVEVRQGDGGEYDLNLCDAIFINAGATHPRSVWFDRLQPGGRLILFLTVAADDSATGRGGVLKVKRESRGYTASFLYSVAVFHCVGSRNEEANRRLRQALMRSGWGSVRSLHRDAHGPSDTCWLHGDGFCLSTLTIPED